MQYLYKTSQLLNLAPAVSTRPDETHSALIVSQESFQGGVRFEGSVCTLEQLRVGAANPWETAWLVWNYADNDHFYYFTMNISLPFLRYYISNFPFLRIEIVTDG